MDTYFHDSAAAVHNYIMFETSSGGPETPQEGFFNVWKSESGTKIVDAEAGEF